ncbi:MAG: hypothetical protein ACSLE1_03150 [Sphingobium sp.]
MTILAHPSTILSVLEEAEQCHREFHAYVNDPHGDLDEHLLGAMEMHDELARRQLGDLITALIGVDAGRIAKVLAL